MTNQPMQTLSGGEHLRPVVVAQVTTGSESHLPSVVTSVPLGPTPEVKGLDCARLLEPEPILPPEPKVELPVPIYPVKLTETNLFEQMWNHPAKLETVAAIYEREGDQAPAVVEQFREQLSQLVEYIETPEIWTEIWQRLDAVMENGVMGTRQAITDLVSALKTPGLTETERSEKVGLLVECLAFQRKMIATAFPDVQYTYQFDPKMVTSDKQLPKPAATPRELLCNSFALCHSQSLVQLRWNQGTGITGFFAGKNTEDDAMRFGFHTDPVFELPQPNERLPHQYLLLFQSSRFAQPDQLSVGVSLFTQVQDPVPEIRYDGPWFSIQDTAKMPLRWTRIEHLHHSWINQIKIGDEISIHLTPYHPDQNVFSQGMLLSTSKPDLSSQTSQTWENIDLFIHTLIGKLYNQSTDDLYTDFRHYHSLVNQVWRGFNNGHQEKAIQGINQALEGLDHIVDTFPGVLPVKLGMMLELAHILQLHAIAIPEAIFERFIDHIKFLKPSVLTNMCTFQNEVLPRSIGLEIFGSLYLMAASRTRDKRQASEWVDRGRDFLDYACLLYQPILPSDRLDYGESDWTLKSGRILWHQFNTVKAMNQTDTATDQVIMLEAIWGLFQLATLKAIHIEHLTGEALAEYLWRQIGGLIAQIERTDDPDTLQVLSAHVEEVGRLVRTHGVQGLQYYVQYDLGVAHYNLANSLEDPASKLSHFKKAVDWLEAFDPGLQALDPQNPTDNRLIQSAIEINADSLLALWWERIRQDQDYPEEDFAKTVAWMEQATPIDPLHYNRHLGWFYYFYGIRHRDVEAFTRARQYLQASYDASEGRSKAWDYVYLNSEAALVDPELNPEIIAGSAQQVLKLQQIEAQIINIMTARQESTGSWFNWSLAYLYRLRAEGSDDSVLRETCIDQAIHYLDQIAQDKDLFEPIDWTLYHRETGRLVVLKALLL